MIKKAIVGLVLAASFLIIEANSASAHHPDIVAENVCITFTRTIKITSTAWNGPTEMRVNNEVSITARRIETDTTILVDSGQFTPENNYQFTVDFSGEAGATYVLRATAIAAWGANGEFHPGGDWRETTITQQPPCEGVIPPIETPPPTVGVTTTIPTNVGPIIVTTTAPTNTITPPSTIPIAPPTSVATTAPTTTVPTGGIQQERERERIRVEGEQLARTGPWHIVGLSLIGIGLIGLGILIVKDRKEFNG